MDSQNTLSISTLISKTQLTFFLFDPQECKELLRASHSPAMCPSENLEPSSQRCDSFLFPRYLVMLGSEIDEKATPFIWPLPHTAFLNIIIFNATRGRGVRIFKKKTVGTVSLKEIIMKLWLKFYTAIYSPSVYWSPTMFQSSRATRWMTDATTTKPGELSLRQILMASEDSVLKTDILWS